MPNYIQSFVTQTYDHAANPPLLDKVVFTIDHIHEGGPGLYSTLDIVKFLTGHQIPVTVFIQCSDPVNRCPAERRNAQQVYDLDPNLVSLGAHSLSKGSSPAEQASNLLLINEMIEDITGSPASTLSYHGSGAGPENGVSYPGIRYARGIISAWSTAQADNVLNTPVMSLSSVNAAFEFIRLRNLADLSATLFVHSVELTNGSPKKEVFDAVLKAVIDKKLQALPYLSAMQSDYQGGSPVTPAGSNCPLRHFSNNQIVQYLRINIRDGVNGVYQVAELQRFLNELGLDAGTVDGIFGLNTKLAVIAYQILQGLTADGIVGSHTRASINTYCD